MEIKYCKNCANFSPIYTKEKIAYEENYSWGFCRIISRIELVNNELRIIQKPLSEVAIEKVVAVNQVVVVGGKRICPAYCNLSDIFISNINDIEIENIDILRELLFVKCQNCFHIFASDKKKPEETNKYTCPVCFHSSGYLPEDHFKMKPDFIWRSFK